MKLFYQRMSIALVAIVVVACCNCRATKGKKNTSILNTEWQLVQIGDENVQPEEDKFTIQFLEEENRFAGVGDCNRLTGVFQLNDKREVRFDQMGMTRMMCPNQEAEDRFVEMINKVDNYDIDGNMLLLFEGKTLLAVFQAKAE